MLLSPTEILDISCPEESR
jgi:hypothetical protein